MEQDLHLSRRAVIGGAGLAVLAGTVADAAAIAVPTGHDRARFLTRAELATLRALVDRVVPGPPEDTTPGAVAGRCHVAIDALLGAFTVSPPLIFAGGPFSDRGGASTNDFEDFLHLDRYETRAWRRRVTRTFQPTYRKGLRRLEASVPGGFSAAPGPARDAAMRRTDDEAIVALVDLAVTHTLQFHYGAPEYGGNRRLVGWTTTDFEGDVQPRGYTRREVTDPETSGPDDLVQDLLGTGPTPPVASAAALASTEVLLGIRAGAGDSWTAVRSTVDELTNLHGEAAELMRQMHDVADDLVARQGEAP